MTPSSCLFYARGNQVACLSLMKHHEATGVDDCLTCPRKAERTKAAKPVARIAIPPVDSQIVPFRAYPKPAEKKASPPVRTGKCSVCGAKTVYAKCWRHQ